MHITDAVETAKAHGLAPPGTTLLEQWHPISLLVNDLNRAIGMRDAYPFVVGDLVRRKIEFIAAQVLTLSEAKRSSAPEHQR